VVSHLLDTAQDILAVLGLNLHGVVDAERYDDLVGKDRRSSTLFPGTKSVWVIGSGGATLWEGFLAALHEDPTRLYTQPHPFDAHVRRCVATADPSLGGSPHRWFHATADADVHLDFRVLAQLAGLGSESRLGLLIHPEFGPWLGLRAACFLTEYVPETGSMEFDPCPPCDAPCVSACPANALGAGRWDVDICGGFHVTDTDCDSTCHARLACPVGTVHRYPEAERVYHYNRAKGRVWLREQLGLSADVDGFEGSGPYWESWRAKVDVKGT
jgi:hypothetical protein